MKNPMIVVTTDHFNKECTRVEVRPTCDADFYGRGIGFVAVFYGTNHHIRASEYAHLLLEHPQGASK